MVILSLLGNLSILWNSVRIKWNYIIVAYTTRNGICDMNIMHHLLWKYALRLNPPESQEFHFPLLSQEDVPIPSQSDRQLHPRKTIRTLLVVPLLMLEPS